jgi:Ca2+-binding RTX toxin-like protein
MRAVLIALNLALVAATPAGAATLSYSVGNSAYLIKGGGGDEQLATGASPTGMSFTGTNLIANPTALGAGQCTQVGDGYDCAALVVRVIIRGNGGDDQVGGDGSALNVPLRVFGGTGNDVVIGGPRNDVLEGDQGNDTFRPGLGGDSVLGDCNTGLTCKNGNDTLDLSTDGRRGVTASLESGPDPADITSSVENLIGTDGDDVLNGGAGANHIDGLAGDDTIDVRDTSADTVDCGDGSDTVTADSSDRLTACETPDVAPRVRAPRAGKLTAGDATLRGDTLILAGSAKCAAGAGRCRLRIIVAGLGFHNRHVAPGKRVKLVDPLTKRTAGVLRHSEPQTPHITVLLSKPGRQTVKRVYDARISVPR